MMTQLPLTAPVPAPVRVESTIYRGWYDPDKHRPVAQKVADACERFEQRRGHAPNVCLCSAADAEGLPGIPGIEVRALGYVPRNTFYVGREGST